jgi:hypothetical protein
MNLTSVWDICSSNGDSLTSSASLISSYSLPIGCGTKHEPDNNLATKISTPVGACSPKDVKIEKVKVEKIPVYGGYPKVDRIIYSGNKTIVIWKDKTKTIVACSEGETYDEFDGFTACLAKKIYGSTCAVKREIKAHRQADKQTKTV